MQRELSYESHRRDIGKTFEVLAEGPSKRSDEHFFGRNSQNKVIVFPKEGTQPGQLLNVTVNNCTTATLLGKITR